MITDDTTDEDIMVMYQNGSEEAFSTLYKRHSGKIYGYVKSKIRAEDRARDAFQEVFIKMHRSKHLYNRTFPVLPWMFTISRSVVLDEFRKQKNLVLLKEELGVATEISLSAPSRDLSPALASLPDTQRKAVEMRYVDEKTFDEIAEHLGTSSSNVRQLVSRGVRYLRGILKGGGDNE